MKSVKPEGRGTKITKFKLSKRDYLFYTVPILQVLQPLPSHLTPAVRTRRSSLCPFSWVSEMTKLSLTWTVCRQDSADTNDWQELSEWPAIDHMQVLRSCH